ncbi:MAG: two-component regulator propeller domain-containing protein [Calditrichia bacterium]
MKRYIKFLYLIVLFLSSIIFPLPAQFIESKFDKLPPVVVPNCVFQDSYGFIWIGAQEGLIRYDGYHLKKYTQIPYDSTSLSINWINVIREDSLGNLWIGTTGGGLNYFNQKTEKFIHYIHHPDLKVNPRRVILPVKISFWIFIKMIREFCG